MLKYLVPHDHHFTCNMLCSTILNTAQPIVAKTLDIVDTFTRFIRCIRNESVNRRRIMIFNSHKPEIYLDSPLHTLRLISAYNCSNPLNRVAAEYAEPEAELFCGSPPNITPLPATFLEFFDALSSITRVIDNAYYHAHADILFFFEGHPDI